jgi:hypothetical protein
MKSETDKLFMAALWVLIGALFAAIAWFVLRTSIDYRHTPEDACSSQLEFLRAKFVSARLNSGSNVVHPLGELGLIPKDLRCPVTEQLYTIHFALSNGVKSEFFVLCDSDPHNGIRYIGSSDTQVSTLKPSEMGILSTFSGTNWTTAHVDALLK